MSILPKVHWADRVAFGTEEFWVPAAIAALGTGAQYVNQSNANKRQQTAEVQAIGDQQQIRGNANSQVKQLTDQIAQNTPTQLQGQETGAFVNTLRKNAAGSTQGGPTNLNDTNFGAPVSALAPAAGASSRYKSDAATSQQQTQQFGNTYADEIGKIDAAVRQRQNEGLAQSTLGTSLNGLGAQSYTKSFVDQLRAQAAGQANPWVSLFAGVLKNGGMAAAANGWGSPGATSAAGQVTNNVTPSGFLNQGGYMVGTP